MICLNPKCSSELPDNAVYCTYCGRKQLRSRSPKSRGNGQGSVYKLRNGKYKAVVTLRYYMDTDGKVKRQTRSKVFIRKKDAIAALPELISMPSSRALKDLTFQQLYDAWLPTHRAGKSTMDCYKAAFKHFRPIWCIPMSDMSIDDLQECVDGCGKGRRTQENMRALVGLMYKYGIPRRAIPDKLNLAPYILVGGDPAAHRPSFTDVQIEAIRRCVGLIPHADTVIAMIYTGFRPSEFLQLKVEEFDRQKVCLIGGSKTAAGVDRVVTISPKIAPIIIGAAAGRSTGWLFPAPDGKAWSLRAYTDAAFYPVLKAAGINNPIVTIGGGVERHLYTPHSCRHTFATLLKRIEAPSKDKQELIGHASEEMLKYYQDVDIQDLKRITDAI